MWFMHSVFVWIVWEAAELVFMQKNPVWTWVAAQLVPSASSPCLLCDMQSFKYKRAMSDACLFPVSLQYKQFYAADVRCLLLTAWKCLISNSQIAAQKSTQSCMHLHCCSLMKQSNRQASRCQHCSLSASYHHVCIHVLRYHHHCSCQSDHRSWKCMRRLPPECRHSLEQQGLLVFSRHLEKIGPSLWWSTTTHWSLCEPWCCHALWCIHWQELWCYLLAISGFLIALGILK